MWTMLALLRLENSPPASSSSSSRARNRLKGVFESLFSLVKTCPLFVFVAVARPSAVRHSKGFTLFSATAFHSIMLTCNAATVMRVDARVCGPRASLRCCRWRILLFIYLLIHSFIRSLIHMTCFSFTQDKTYNIRVHVEYFERAIRLKER